MRTLKSIANNKELGLTIQNIELTHYNDKQIDLLYKHDIEFDEMIPDNVKQNSNLRDRFLEIFRKGENRVV